MRIVFAGSPAVAVPSLDRLAASHDVAAVATRAPSPVGRRRTLTPTPVGEAAERLGLPVIEADRLDANATEAIMQHAPDLGVVVAYGGLIREPLLSAPTHGWINLHFSLLPAYRGAAPVQRALLDGARVTGVSIFRLVPELDAGPLYRRLEVPVPPRATAGDLLDDLAVVGARLIADVVDDIEAGRHEPVPQTGTPTYAPKLALSDGALDVTLPAGQVLDRFRGATPEPGASIIVDGARVKVLGLERSAADPVPAGRITLAGREAVLGTATAPLALGSVQPAGKRPMPAADWLRGRGGSAEAER